MKNFNTHKVWAGITLVTFVIAGILYLLQTNPAIVIFGNQHTAVLVRVWNEVLPKSSAGRSYRRLFIKHAFEINRILKEHPAHVDETSKLIEKFLPVLEARPGDKDDTARITTEQINALQVELNWISSLASLSLRNDIEKEQKRFPLKNLVGMTLNEALDYADSNWSLASTAFALTPTQVPFPTETPQPLPICLVGTGADCVAPPSLVSNSDGKWAYHVVKNVYFEYPSDWDVKQDFDYYQTVTFVPPASSPVGLNTTVIKFIFTYANLPDDVDYDLIACDAPGTVSQWPPLLFHREITDSDFRGSEILWDLSSPSTTLLVLQASTYSESQQLILCLFTIAQGDQTKKDLLTTNPKLVEREFSNFHHILESIRIWDKNGFIVPTARVTETLPPSPVVTEAPAASSSEGPWASEVINGVYFEYPQEWQVRRSGESSAQILSFMPAANSFEELNTKLTILGVIQNVSVPEDILLDKLSCSPEGPFQQPVSIWHQPIVLDDFEGSEFLWEDATGSLQYLEVVLYNKDRQQMICLATEIYPDPNGQLTNTPEITKENFSSFHHILESIKVVDQ